MHPASRMWGRSSSTPRFPFPLPPQQQAQQQQPRGPPPHPTTDDSTEAHAHDLSSVSTLSSSSSDADANRHRPSRTVLRLPPRRANGGHTRASMSSVMEAAAPGNRHDHVVAGLQQRLAATEQANAALGERARMVVGEAERTQENLARCLGELEEVRWGV